GSASDWAAVSCGDDYTTALRTDGSLWVWGYNGFGQLGLGDTKDMHAPAEVGRQGDWAAVSCGTSHTVALKIDGSLWAWGYNGFGQLGLGDTDNRLVPAEIGSSSS
ncbi:MAG: chromosome condensation regulator RCC1, partial [Thermoleophilia bacterium]